MGGGGEECTKYAPFFLSLTSVDLKALLSPLLALESNLVPDANLFIPFWTGILVRLVSVRRRTYPDC